jgi:SM-20-related protein
MPLPDEPAPTAPDEIAGALAEPGYVVVPDFLDEATGLALLAEIRASRERGDLHEAAVGRGGEKQVRSEIRSDHVLWLDPAELSPAQSRYWEALETVRASLNRELFLGLFDLEAHLACYPPGAFYKAHLDCHRGVSVRTVSAILYLNRDWTPDDGGLLRLYTDREAGTSGPFLDIAPEFGKLVLFLSADFWHEVLPAKRERFSLTGWFRKREAALV